MEQGSSTPLYPRIVANCWNLPIFASKPKCVSIGPEINLVPTVTTATLRTDIAKFERRGIVRLDIIDRDPRYVIEVYLIEYVDRTFTRNRKYDYYLCLDKMLRPHINGIFYHDLVGLFMFLKWIYTMSMALIVGL